jgi:hypothetical protein
LPLLKSDMDRNRHLFVMAARPAPGFARENCPLRKSGERGRACAAGVQERYGLGYLCKTFESWDIAVKEMNSLPTFRTYDDVSQVSNNTKKMVHEYEHRRGGLERLRGAVASTGTSPDCSARSAL